MVVHREFAESGESTLEGSGGLPEGRLTLSRREDREGNDPIRVLLVKSPYLVVVFPDKVRVFPREAEHNGFIYGGSIKILDDVRLGNELGLRRGVYGTERRIAVTKRCSIELDPSRQQVDMAIDNHTSRYMSGISPASPTILIWTTIYLRTRMRISQVI